MTQHPGPSFATRLLRLGGFAVATSAAGLTFAMFTLSERAARSIVFPPHAVDDRTPASIGLTYQEVAFPSGDGTALRGWLIPGGPAAVVVAHGHGGSKGQVLDYARFLRERGGYTVLLFDFRASGQSDGEKVTLGFYERQDVLGALDFLSRQSGLDSHRIGGLGLSMGAAALLLLGPDAQRLRGIVADSSFTDGQSLVSHFDRWFHLPSWPFSVTVPWAIERFAGLAPRDVAPVKTAASIAPTPLFIIHGSDDQGIPATDAVAIHAAAGEPKQLWIVPGAEHGAALAVAGEEYKQRVLAFFRSTL